jgi:outer membrane protein TolC
LTPPKIREHFAPINDQPGGLTAEQAGRAASTVSPDAEAAQAKVDSANASVNQVTWKYLPRLTLSASYTRLSNQPTVQNALGSLVVTDQTTAGPIGPGSQLIAAPATQAFQQVQDQWYLNAELLVPLSDYVFNVKQAVGGARSAQEAARLTERAERVTASANAKIAYYDWVGAKLAARETDKSVERARKQYETLKAQQAAGRAARADVLRADAFLSATELDQVRARTQESIARERLNVLMTGGVETNQPQYAIGEDILNPPVVRTADQKSISELQQEAITYRMELRALRKTQEALDQKAKVDRSMAYPRVEGFGNLTYANPNPRVIPQVDQWFATWNVGVRATFTVNDVGINRAEVKKTQADIAELTAQRKGIEYGLRTEVLSAYQVEKEARLAVGTAARGLDAAEAAYRDRVLLYENGRATSLDLLEAESALVGARLDLVQTYVALKKARVRLDHALGRDAREIYPEDQE